MDQKSRRIWKYVAIGCVVVVALVSAVIGYGIYRFTELPRLHWRAVANNERYPFTPTQDGVVTADRLDAWIGVQRTMLPFQTMFNFNKNFSDGDALKNLSSMFAAGANGDIALKAYLPGVVAALEATHMSTQEYRWIFGQAVAALDSPAAAKDPAFAELLGKWPRHKFPPELAILGQASEAQTAHLLELLRERRPAMLETIGMLDLPALDMTGGLKATLFEEGPGLLSFPPRHLGE